MKTGPLPQGEVVSPSRGESHILQEFIDWWWIEEKEKKVRKKGSTICPLKKVRLEGSPKVAPFFQWWNKRALPK
jgi:hypothetical protein